LCRNLIYYSGRITVADYSGGVLLELLWRDYFSRVTPADYSGRITLEDYSGGLLLKLL